MLGDRWMRGADELARNSIKPENGSRMSKNRGGQTNHVNCGSNGTTLRCDLLASLLRLADFFQRRLNHIYVKLELLDAFIVIIIVILYVLDGFEEVADFNHWPMKFLLSPRILLL